MTRTAVVTGAASGIGAATAAYLRQRAIRVITSDLRDADVCADLATAEGRAFFIEGVTRQSGGVLDVVVANAGGGPPATSVQLNFFGSVATLEGLRPLLERSAAPRAVAVSSIAALGPPHADLVDACLARDEPTALQVAQGLCGGAMESSRVAVERALALYGSAKLALNRWCRSVAAGPDWAGVGIVLNVVALGFFDTPSAAYILGDAESRESMQGRVPLRGAFPGHPQEAAALLAWLTSAENSQLAGQVMYADGGFECRARGSSA